MEAASLSDAVHAASLISVRVWYNQGYAEDEHRYPWYHLLFCFCHFELSVAQSVIKNVKICRLLVLPLEVQVTYRSSHFW